MWLIVKQTVHWWRTARWESDMPWGGDGNQCHKLGISESRSRSRVGVTTSGVARAPSNTPWRANSHLPLSSNTRSHRPHGFTLISPPHRTTTFLRLVHSLNSRNRDDSQMSSKHLKTTFTKHWWTRRQRENSCLKFSRKCYHKVKYNETSYNVKKRKLYLLEWRKNN